MSLLAAVVGAGKGLGIGRGGGVRDGGGGAVGALRVGVKTVHHGAQRPPFQRLQPVAFGPNELHFACAPSWQDSPRGSSDPSSATPPPPPPPSLLWPANQPHLFTPPQPDWGFSHSNSADASNPPSRPPPPHTHTPHPLPPLPPLL